MDNKRKLPDISCVIMKKMEKAIETRDRDVLLMGIRVFNSILSDHQRWNFCIQYLHYMDDAPLDEVIDTCKQIAADIKEHFECTSGSTDTLKSF